MRGAAAVIAALAVAVLVRAPTLGQPLLEKHGFRQTQTAYGALWFQEHGIDLLRPRLPTLGQTYDVPLEFPLFQAFGAALMSLPVPADTAMRLAGLATFVLSAVALYALVRRVATRTAAAAALAIFLCTPFSLVWSRASLIEHLAVAASLAYLAFGVDWLEGRKARSLGLALACGAIAMLVKLPTAVFLTVPLALLAIGVRRAWRDPAVWALLGAPFAVGLAWTAFADSVKARDAATAFLTSSANRELDFGTLAQRLEPARWWRVAERIGLWVVGLPLLPALALGVIAGWRSAYRRFWMGAALATPLAVGTLFNLYYQHDYYLLALAPLLVALTALGVDAALRWRPALMARAAAVAAVSVALALSMATTAPYWRPIYAGTVDPEGVLPRAAELASLSSPGERVVVVGRSYNSDLLYYARRPGQLLAPALLDYSFLATLPARGYQLVFAWDPIADPTVFVVTYWPWVGVVGSHTYRVGATPAALLGAGMVATSDVAAFDRAAASGRALTAGPIVVPCDGQGAVIPRGDRGTWIRLAPPADPNAYVRASLALAPLTVRPVLFISRERAAQDRAGGPIALLCGRSPRLVIESIVDADPPR